MLPAMLKGCILMVAMFSITVTGVRDPGKITKNIFGFIESEYKPYSYAQIQLEEIAEYAELYSLPENERISVEKELIKNPTVQEIIEQCNKFHYQPNCTKGIYRTHDGTCNNLKYPLWGSSNYLMERYLPANYEGASDLRNSFKGGNLPNARSISLKLIDKDNPSQKASALFTFFGQIIAHDMSSAPSFSNDKGEILDCCSDPAEKTPFCKSVYIPKDDPFYLKLNKTCLTMGRTAPYPKCNFERRSLLNKENSFIDLSTIYGSYEIISNELQAKDGSGKLKAQHTTHGDILTPNNIQDLSFCPILQTTTCFTSGDDRVNMHSMLLALHVVFLRFHNAIADKLHALNPKWDDEKLYQEARRIVIAAYQNIIYKEYLPLLVTPALIQEYQLSVDEDSLYNEEINPSALTGFTTASFRLHSMIPKAVSTKLPDIRFSDTYSNLQLIHEGNTESLVSGSCEVPSEKNDRYFKEDIFNYLYIQKESDFGFDLTAMDIQRGRDHGLPCYVDVLRQCSDGKIDIQDFSDLSQVMSDQNLKLLQGIYKDVLDIDLMIGLVMEREEDSIVTGFTAACMNAEQFHRSKFGDSFFFTHTNGRYPFTKDQLKSIRSTTFSNMICQAGGFTSICKDTMKLPSCKNGDVDCKSVPPFDLTPWKDTSEEDGSFPKKDDEPKHKTCYFFVFCF